MAVSPTALAKVMATAVGRNTYLATRGYITNEIQSEILDLLSERDKETYLCGLYRELGYEEYIPKDKSSGSGHVFIKGTQKRFVSTGPKKTSVSLHWPMS